MPPLKSTISWGVSTLLKESSSAKNLTVSGHYRRITAHFTLEWHAGSHRQIRVQTWADQACNTFRTNCSHGPRPPVIVPGCIASSDTFQPETRLANFSV